MHTRKQKYTCGNIFVFILLQNLFFCMNYLMICAMYTQLIKYTKTDKTKINRYNNQLNNDIIVRYFNIKNTAFTPDQEIISYHPENYMPRD